MTYNKKRYENHHHHQLRTTASDFVSPLLNDSAMNSASVWNNANNLKKNPFDKRHSKINLPGRVDETENSRGNSSLSIQPDVIPVQLANK